MDDNRLCRGMGMEEERRNGEKSWKIFKMDTRNRLKNTWIFNEEGIIIQKNTKGKDGAGKRTELRV